MTIQEVINWFTQNPYSILGYFIVLLVVTVLAVSIVNQTNFKNLKYIMSALVYGVTVPGILAVLLVLYNLLFLRANLLNLSVIAYFVPIVAMIATIVILNRKVTMKDIPGFDKLAALMVIIGICFIILFVLQKSIFGVFFIGGFTQLLVVFVVLLIVIKLSWAKLRK